MSKRSSILSLLLLIVYGTLALVAVPLHQHSSEYVDTPQVHAPSSFHSAECSVCTFSSGSAHDDVPVVTSVILVAASVPVLPQTESVVAVTPAHAYPHRGPPSILL